MSSQLDDLLDQLFPEQSRAEQVLALATHMSVEPDNVGGKLCFRFTISGFVPIGTSKKRETHYIGLLYGTEYDVNAQGQARAAASKSRRRRTTGRSRKGGAQ